MTTRTSGALAGVRVGDVMTSSPESVAPGTTIARFLEHVSAGAQQPAFPVVSWGRPIGLVTLSRARAVPQDERSWTRVVDIVCPMAVVPVATLEEPLADLLPRLERSADGCALVLAGGTLAGIVSAADVARALAEAGSRGKSRGALPG